MNGLILMSIIYNARGNRDEDILNYILKTYMNYYQM